MSEPHLMGATRYVERNPVKAGLVERAEDWSWSSAAAHCGSDGDSQTVAECDWLSDRTAGMISTWSEHLAWQDDAELAALIRQGESTGRPVGDQEFLRQIGQQLSRDLLPQKRGPKGPRKKRKKAKKTKARRVQ